MDREELLAASIDYAARVGLADFSMRACAAAIGTSHRMLGYHFGTKDQFLAAIIDAAAAGQRAWIDAFVAARQASPTPMTPEDVDQGIAALLLDENSVRYAPLMAEATYLIARHPGRFKGQAQTYDDIVNLWEPQLTSLMGLENLPVTQRRGRVRLTVAVLVGLSVDYLGARDPQAYFSAYREWIRLALEI